MAQSFKKAVQSALLLPRKKQYEKDYERLFEEYTKRCAAVDAYVSKVSDETKSRVERLEIKDFYDNLSSDFVYDQTKFYLIYDSNHGILRNESDRIVYEYTLNNPYAVMVYGDEDYFAVTEDLKDDDCIKKCRSIRYFKPCFSPETLASFDYINAFAVRGDWLNEAVTQKNEALKAADKDILIYEIALEICAIIKHEKAEESIVHIPAVFVSNALQINAKELSDGECGEAELLYREFEKIPPLFSEDKYKDFREEAGEKLDIRPKDEDVFVSVIIPSKDNPDMLISCLEGLEISSMKNTELIVVDNGSSEENKKRIEEYLKGCEIETNYIYSVFDFDYSKMNNMAAKEARCDVLLLLNDDVEAKGNEWIKKMANETLVPEVGCVGCKLLYPDGLVQHVGISGGVDGPAHKFMGEEDGKKLGFGDNTMNKNVLAVTGACLAIRKDLYLEVGGLSEDLKVGYNDVDLCMNLYEKGLRNVLLNDVVLTHHESVSRGRDAASKAKSERLLKEREILKKKHPALMITDPYEGGTADFKLAFEKENEDTAINASGKFEKRKANDEEGWIYSSFEELKTENVDGKKVLFARGFALVPGIDNMRFDFDLILENEGKQFVIPIERNLRTDLEGRFNGSQNTQLCGMNIRASVDALKSGEYEVKIYGRDHGNVREIITDTTQRIEI